MVFLCIAATVAVWPLWKKDDLGYWPWEDTAIRSGSIADSSPEMIPAYNGDSVIELNGGKPCFSAEDLLTITGENYSELDRLGRCGTAVVMLDKTMMPIEQRGAIGNIKPTGWVQKKYPGIVDSEPPYLYNRSHLIAYSMTGACIECRHTLRGRRNWPEVWSWKHIPLKIMEKVFVFTCFCITCSLG